MLQQMAEGSAAPGRPIRTLALTAVAVAVATWGSSNVVIKAISTTGLVASFYRLWFAIPLLWVMTLCLPGARSRLTRAWLTASLGGGLLFGIHQLLFFNSLKLTSVANVSIIGALQPALVLLLAGRMFGERVTAAAMLWVALAVAGTAIVVLGSAATAGWRPLGDVLAVINLLAFTAYFLASKRFRSHVGALEYVMGMTTVSGFVILAAALTTGQDLGSPRGPDWPFLVFLAVFPGTMGHFLTNWAHPHIPAFALSMMLLAVPVVASLGAALFIHEPLNLTQAAGGAIVLTAIAIIVRSTREPVAGELAGSAAETDAP